MDPRRLRDITDRYQHLRIAVLGDFCLDRYLEIDPARQEISLETGLPVHNVVQVRAQPGAAGTALNNLVALGAGEVVPLGFAGDDGEGSELVRGLWALPGVRMDAFLITPLRRTFTYCKPLVVEAGRPPRELNRLDSKNWTPTPREVEDHFIAALERHAGQIDALVIMDQVDVAETGVVTRRVLDAVGEIARCRPQLRIVADSRRSLRGYPAVCLKMNRAELGVLLGGLSQFSCPTGDYAPTTVGAGHENGTVPFGPLADLEQVKTATSELARRHEREVFITLAEEGLLGASPGGEAAHLPALPVRGDIDIVGAGDAVTANVAAALAAGASLPEALELANAAASVVIHQLGTTGAASVGQIAERLGISPPPGAGPSSLELPCSS